MTRSVEPKANAIVVLLCRFFLTSCFFLACHNLIYGQDALKPEDFKQYGNWDLTGKTFRPLLGLPDELDASGSLHYLKRLPENFEIVFRWKEIGKTNAETLAGGLGFSTDDFYRIKSHNGAYGRKIFCAFSGFSLNLHTKDPTLPAKITAVTHGDIVESRPNNFLKPPGKENQGRLACFGDMLQVIVNDCLVYQFNIRDLISDSVEPNIYAGLGDDLKVWNDARKRGLFLSVGILRLKEDSGDGVINEISIRDFGKSVDDRCSPLVDPKSSRYADWCRNDRWNFTDDKAYKNIYNFLINKKYLFSSQSIDSLFPKFNGMTNPGGTNNASLIQSFLSENCSDNFVRSIFRAQLNDIFQSRITIMQFKNEEISRQYFDRCNHSFSEMISEGQIFQCINGKYIAIIYRNNMGAKKSDFIDFCKKIAEIAK